MSGERDDPLRFLPEIDVPELSSFVLGHDPNHDDDSIAQYAGGLMSVGIRNELITDFSGANVFDFIQRDIYREVRQIGKKATVLTVGAGSGELEYKLAMATWDLKPTIIATDLYPNFHSFQAAAAGNRLNFLHYVRMDARDLKLPDDCVDMAVAPFILYHVGGEAGGPEEVVKELFRVSRLGAKTLIATRGPRHMRQLWQEWMPNIADYLGQSSLVDYKPPQVWYPNCDLAGTEQLLDKIYGNKRATFSQISPAELVLSGSSTEHAPGDYINIPATEEGWKRVQWAIHALHHNIRPVPPEGDALTEAANAVVKEDFFETAARNGGLYPLEIEQAVFEAIKI